MKVLDALDCAGLTENTIIIRYADHGEMAVSHGLREKMYTAYEEAIHIPLIISNPALWSSPQQSDALVSLIDIVPTIADLAGATRPSTAVGRSLTPIINGLSSEVHPYGVVYTYDDTAIVSTLANELGQIRTLRQPFWKYSVYFNEKAQPGVFQYELYNLGSDPAEMDNLAWGTDIPASICQQWRALHATLTQQLGEMNALPSSWPAQTDLPCTP
jgi:arylsulfatase A-like enzyme